MKFHNDISSNFFVYDKNLPSYDFLKIEKTQKISISLNNHISSKFFVYDKNLPSYDFLNIEKRPVVIRFAAIRGGGRKEEDLSNI